MKYELDPSSPIPRWDPDGEPPDLLLFPVRHYSPAASLALLDVIDRLEPASILIEGPANFNEEIDQLSLDHALPIAIYSWVRMSDGSKRSAFYPLCEFSPEWVALQAAFERGIEARFIDLPWREMSLLTNESHRYGNERMRENPYPDALARKLGVDGFDDVWDRLFEIEELDGPAYHDRAHDFCYHLRVFGPQFNPEFAAREAYMADEIEAAIAQADGPVLVVTGGFHSTGIWARLRGVQLEHWEPDDELKTLDETGKPGDESGGDEAFEAVPDALRELMESEAEPLEVADTGIAITPFSYPRIDRLAGNVAGLAGPAFYEHVWRRRRSGQVVDSMPLLEEIVGELRERNQIASTADVVAVRSTAESLARMRGHAGVWRFDLLDALSASLVKEETDRELSHPVFQVARTVLRGTRRGALSVDAKRPPFVTAVESALVALDLELDENPRRVKLDLAVERDRDRSRILHRLRAVGVEGFKLVSAVDFAAREDLSDLSETWDLRWSPEHDASLVEAAIYGTDLDEAATNVVHERASELDGRAVAATRLALDVAQMGLPFDSAELPQKLQRRIAEDGDFFSVSSAVGDLLYLYSYDEVLGTVGQEDLGELFVDALRRGLWLLESLGTVKDRDRELLDGVRSLYRSFRAVRDELADSESFVGPMRRAAASDGQIPLVRGAAMGALYSLGELAIGPILVTMHALREPADLGDFLVGFFSLAREAAQRDPRLLTMIDRVVTTLPEEEFLELAPALRFAFTFFTPREKHALVDILFGEGTLESGARFVPADAAARAAELERRIVATLTRFGLRGARSPGRKPAGEGEDGNTEARDDSEDAGEGAGEGPGEGSGADSAGERSDGVDGDVQSVDAGASRAPAAKGEAHLPESTPVAVPIDPAERAARWKVVLGLGVDDRFPELKDRWEQRDSLLGYLYDREYGSDRNVRGGGGSNDDEARRGGLGESQLTVPDWINGIHELFPKRTIERLERDALDRYHLEEVVTRPEVLKRATPNPTLLKAVLRTKHLMDANVLSIARRLVARVIDELFEKMAREIENPFLGSRNRQRRSLRKIAKNFDAPETIRRNLKHWNAERGQLVIHEPIFNSRVRHHADKWRVVTVVDQSGSMLDSVIHAAVTASVFHGLRAIDSRLVAFDTSIIDLSDDAGDPVETLMRVQLGGGTDIANALEYVESLVTQPSKTLVILITDFFEGASPAHLFAVTKRLVEAGVTLLGLAALDADSNPTYDRQIADEMVRLGAEVGAMTPGELANWVADKVRT